MCEDNVLETLYTCRSDFIPKLFILTIIKIIRIIL